MVENIGLNISTVPPHPNTWQFCNRKIAKNLLTQQRKRQRELPRGQFISAS